MADKITPAKPYLIRAIYEWLVDNELTPYIEVDTTYPRVGVPKACIDEDNSIVLDIAPDSVQHLVIDNEALTCKASFDGVTHNLYVPIIAISSIYAVENDQGMTFLHKEEEEYENAPHVQDSGAIQPISPKNKLKLRIITGGEDETPN